MWRMPNDTPPTPLPFPRFTAIDTWIFDLDNTLYPATTDLFTQVRDRMTHYIGARFGLAFDEARALQRRYYLEHGTTLRGLMSNDGVDPAEFLGFVHDIDLDGLAPATGLRAALARLPGRRLIYTNASTMHAKRVAERLGIFDLFDAVFDIVAADFEPKPDQAAFDRMVAAHGVDPRRAAFFEDIGRNLQPAAARGMATVLVRGNDEPGLDDGDRAHIHFEVDDLAEWLHALVDGMGGGARALPA
ncbi:MAG: pyrimidine 5'-nucleotidase [Alphaproteobacteria bacterium]